MNPRPPGAAPVVAGAVCLSRPLSEFNRLIEATGLSTADVADVAHVTPRAVQLWRRGHPEPQQSLMLLLELLVEGTITNEWLAAALRRRWTQRFNLFDI